jgi:hypothetical protein
MKKFYLCYLVALLLLVVVAHDIGRTNKRLKSERAVHSRAVR